MEKWTAARHWRKRRSSMDNCHDHKGSDHSFRDCLSCAHFSRMRMPHAPPFAHVLTPIDLPQRQHKKQLQGSSHAVLRRLQHSARLAKKGTPKAEQSYDSRRGASVPFAFSIVESQGERFLICKQCTWKCIFSIARLLFDCLRHSGTLIGCLTGKPSALAFSATLASLVPGGNLLLRSAALHG